MGETEVQQTKTEAAKPIIKTEVGLTDFAVAVTNLDNFTWDGVTIYINGLDGYQAGPYGPIIPGRRLDISFTKFVKGDLRFNVYEHKVNQVIVSVDGYRAPMFGFH